MVVKLWPSPPISVRAKNLTVFRRRLAKPAPVKCFIEDLREEFVRDFVFPMFRANAIYEGRYFLGTSIARPLIAKAQMEIAAAEGADAVSHGATGKGNDQVRFELAYYHFDPEIKVIAPWREWDLNSRESLIAYAKKHDIPVPVTKKRPWSSDRNLLHISFEGGILENPWAEAPEEMYVLSDQSPRRLRTSPNTSRSTFERAIPWPSTARGCLRPAAGQT
jgi:argininosuccinate synthase